MLAAALAHTGLPRTARDPPLAWAFRDENVSRRFASALTYARGNQLHDVNKRDATLRAPIIPRSYSYPKTRR